MPPPQNESHNKDLPVEKAPVEKPIVSPIKFSQANQRKAKPSFKSTKKTPKKEKVQVMTMDEGNDELNMEDMDAHLSHFIGLTISKACNHELIEP